MLNRLYDVTRRVRLAVNILRGNPVMYRMQFHGKSIKGRGGPVSIDSCTFDVQPEFELNNGEV